jgi:hypothetical protein
LVNALKGPADDLGPTVRDLGDLAPDLEALFRDLSPLVRASATGVPDLERFIRGAEPVLESAHAFFPELNPILSLLNFHQATVAGFITNAAADLTGATGREGGDRYQTQIGVIDADSFLRPTKQPARERASAYPAPNQYNRGFAFGTREESFDCNQAGGEVRDAIDSGPDKQPPCFVQPGSLFNGEKYNRLGRGEAPVRRAPRDLEGRVPANPNR